MTNTKEEAAKRFLPQTSLYCILARKAPVGVVFRRGPSKQVLLIKWDLENDTFEYGQWLKGRIHEEYCDLSPWGDKLIYFAATYKGPFHTWTAISKPPWLTALALWPKGDTWPGGGLFLKQRKVMVNHPDCQMELAKGFELMKGLAVAGAGKDYPAGTISLRRRRDGWFLKRRYRLAGKQRLEVLEKTFVLGESHKFVLRMIYVGMREDGSYAPIWEFEIADAERGLVTRLGETPWADWDKNGEVLFARQGKLFRLKPREEERFFAEDAVEIADFSSLRFKKRAAPDHALRWGR